MAFVYHESMWTQGDPLTCQPYLWFPNITACSWFRIICPLQLQFGLLAFPLAETSKSPWPYTGFLVIHQNWAAWSNMDTIYAIWIHIGPIWIHIESIVGPYGRMGPWARPLPMGRGWAWARAPPNGRELFWLINLYFFIELSTPAKNKFINQIFFLIWV